MIEVNFLRIQFNQNYVYYFIRKLYYYIALRGCVTIKTHVDRHPFHFTPEKRNGKMNTTQVKTCEKKLKAAELKISKILNKIDSLNLNSSYISKLNVKGKRKISLVFLSKSQWFNVSFAIVVFSVLISVVWWAYTEWPSSQVSTFI